MQNVIKRLDMIKKETGDEIRSDGPLVALILGVYEKDEMKNLEDITGDLMEMG